MAAKDDASVKIFLALLRSGLYGTPVPEEYLPESIDWGAVVALARKHTVLGIIIDSVQLLPENLRPSAELSTRLTKFALSLIRTNMVMDRTAAELEAFLKQHGIGGALLKGQGVARYYRMPQMRQCGDIDYYIGRTNYKKGAALCREHLATDKKTCAEIEYHFVFEMNGVAIELHRLASRIYMPVRNRRFQKWVTEQLEHSPARRRVEAGKGEITLPPVEFDAIYIFYHAWLHYIMGGIGLRQLCDWAMIFRSHGRDINAGELEANIRRFGMTKGWKLFAGIAVRHLGVPRELMPLYEPAYDRKSETLFEDIMAGGNFGYYSATYAQAMAHKSFLGNGLGKVRAVTKYFTALFPIIPAEATLCYINRLISGPVNYTRRKIRESKS